jgi:predicted transcriptional regulator
VSKYLTIAELADQVGIPNSSCRRYLSTFEEFFLVKGGSRLKRYEQEAVDVLKRIKTLYDDGLESNEIHKVLVGEFAMVINGDEQQTTDEPATVPSLATSEDLQEIRKALDEQREFNKLLVEQMREQHLYYDKKFNELKHDRELIHSLRESMQQKKIESEPREELKNIERQLSEIQQNQNENEEIKALSEQIAELNSHIEQMQLMMKETAVSRQKQGFWQRLFSK